MSYRLDDPQTIEHEMAWGPGVKPGFSDSESDVLPVRRSPKSEKPRLVNAYRGSYPEGRPPPALNYVKASYMVCCWITFIAFKNNVLSRPMQHPPSTLLAL